MLFKDELNNQEETIAKVGKEKKYQNDVNLKKYT